MAGLFVALLAYSQTAQAVQVTGSIGFSGTATVDTSSMASATEVATWINPVVSADSGSFSSVALGSAVNLANPWHFNSGTVNNFWTVGGFTFTLLGSTILQQGGTPGVNGYVVVDGTGTVSGNGYAATAMIWNFTSQDPIAGANPSSWTFGARAASAATPDGGVTMILLGVALSSVALFRRKFAF